MASITKTKTKKGEDRFVLRWRVDGRAVEEWHTTRFAASQRRTEVEFDAYSGRQIDPRPGRDRLNLYFEAWLAARFVRGRRLRPSTRVGYQRLWNRTIAPTLGQRTLRAIRPDVVRAWHGALAEAKGHDQGAKAYRLLHAVLATAETDECIRINPCRIRGAGQTHVRERPMPGTELVMALADAIGDRYRALVLTVAFAGTRTGEVLGLRRTDVDLLHSEIHVRVQAQELPGQGRVELNYTKTDAGRRLIAIPQLLVDALEEHMRHYTASEPGAPVFTGPRGTPLRRATLSSAWREAKQAVTAPEELRLYDLRHHAATTTARMPGITLKELMTRIGHRSVEAALRYQHATRERDHVIAAFLDAHINAIGG